MPVPVLLVSPPFTPLAAPSLGLAMLQGCLRRAGFDSRVWNLGLDFARRVGQGEYAFVAEQIAFTPDLAGDWVFAEALNGRPGDVEGYFTQVIAGTDPDHRKPLGMRLADLEGSRRRLQDLRDQAGPFLDLWAERIAAARPRVLGLSSVFAQNTAALALAQRVKALDAAILVVLGGANAEGSMGDALFETYPCLDVVVSGEGEHRFPPLVEAFLRDLPLPGLAGVRARPRLAAAGPALPVVPVDLDALPVPDYGEWFEEFHAAGLDLESRLLVETSRGCWWGETSHCAFCGLNGGTLAFRSKSAERLLAELRTLRERHPGCGFGVADNILGMDAFKDLLPALAAEPEPPRCFFEVKANLSRAQLGLLKAAGCHGLQPGIESLSDAVLRLMKKGLRALQAVQLLKHCRELDLDVGWNILGGFPGEDPAEYERMARWIPLLTHLQPPYAACRLRLDRFAPLQVHAAAMGLREVHAMPAYGHVYGLPDEVLDRLAYFLRFDYADGRDPHAYLAPVEAAVERWKDRPGSLLAVDQGEGILVFDSRECATSPVHLLVGAEARLLGSCAEATSVQRIQAGPSFDGFSAALASLVAKGLVLEDHGLLLALPIAAVARTPDPAPAPVVLAGSSRDLG